MTKANPVENDVKDAVKKLLDEFGWHHWPAAASKYGVGGVSDRLAIRGRPGKGCIFLALEAKKGSVTTPTKLQQDFLDNVKAQGGIGLVVNADRLPKLRQLLEAIDAELFPPAFELVLDQGKAFGDFGWTKDSSTGDKL